MEYQAETRQARSFFYQAAKASYVSPLLAIAVNWGTRSVVREHRTLAIIVLSVNIAFIAVGFISAIIALFGIPRHGRKGLLSPAIGGILLSAFLLLSVILSMAMVKRAKEKADDELRRFEQMGEDSFLKHPGWYGGVEFQGAAIGMAEINEESAFAQDIMKEFGRKFTVLLVTVDNSQGKSTIRLDPSSIRLRNADGDIVNALPLKDVMATARTDKDDWLARYSGKIRVTPGKKVLDRFACLPPNIDMRQIVEIDIDAEGKWPTVQGEFLTAEQRQKLSEQGKALMEQSE